MGSIAEPNRPETAAVTSDRNGGHTLVSLVGYFASHTPPATSRPASLDRLSDGSHESSVLWEHTPAAAVPYLVLGAEISLVG